MLIGKDYSFHDNELCCSVLPLKFQVCFKNTSTLPAHFCEHIVTTLAHRSMSSVDWSQKEALLDILSLGREGSNASQLWNCRRNKDVQMLQRRSKTWGINSWTKGKIASDAATQVSWSYAEPGVIVSRAP